MRFGVRRARKCARAPNFFINVNFVKKYRCNFFGLFIVQKAKILDLFEVSWYFWKIDFFQKNFKISKFEKILKKNFFFTKKHEFQMRLQQPIQEVGIHSRYLGDANFHEEYDDKNFLTSARAGRIFGFLSSNLMVFEFSQRYEVWRAPRAQVRAIPKFFY